jgi:heme-degrading monooxygenase HmoA
MTATMSDSGFANLPRPPYYAVIFSSRRSAQDDAGYAQASQRMLEVAAQQPGFLGVESSRDAEGFGITVSYWVDEASISGWKAQAEHAAIRERGRWLWYSHFEVRVAKVERAYGQVRAHVA